MVSYARSLCEDVEFSAEDALRSDPEFLYQVYSVAVEVGGFMYICVCMYVEKCVGGGCVFDLWRRLPRRPAGHALAHD